MGHRSCAEYERKGSPEDIKTRRNGCLRRFCCNKCVLCLLICAAVLTVACAIGVFVMVQIFGMSGGNFTTFDDSGSAAEFYESWKAPEEIKQKANSYIGRDKNKLTVCFIDFGQWELDVLLRSSGTKQDLSNYIDQRFYRNRNGIKGQHEHNSSWAMVVNMDGYGISQAFDFTATAYLQELVKRNISNLKTLDYAVVINLPSWARFLTGIMKPLMGNLLDKFEMFGYEDWLPALLRRIDAQELPKGYHAYAGDGDDDGNDNDDGHGGNSWFS